MKIYTKTGDRGTTSLFGGKRVDKDSARIEAYGNVDELNSLIGVVINDLDNYSSSEAQRSREVPVKRNSPLGRMLSKLLRIQAELFVLGADLSTPVDVKVKVPRIMKPFITRLEKEIDYWEKDLPKIKNFILPGGGKIGSNLHLARTIARRCERSIVTLSKLDKINEQSLRSSSSKNSTAGLKYAQMYINRLSDWLFVAARFVNHQDKISETIWKGRR